MAGSTILRCVQTSLPQRLPISWAKKKMLSTTSENRSAKPYYVTTPIFYVNAAPHVGHLYSMVLADVLKRWQVLKGRPAILCTGTDEHGMKIQRAAAAANKPPKEFCDITADTFKSLAERAHISNDHFVRTSNQDHKDAVQYFWQILKQTGHIYEANHEGWYSVSDETFYPASTIEKRLDPYTGRTFMASKETGQEVEWTSEKNYHFRLSAFKDQLLEFYAANPNWITPPSRMKDVVQWVSEGLEDLSISRPIERLTWGVRVPDDEGQTVYVWLDALINYIVKAGYPWAPGKEHAGGWPADVQVIGKDIVRFHCIYWPAFLMALDLQPPKQILTHGHWTLNNKKMAKSTGNVVNPFFAIDRFGVDLMRFYLIYDGRVETDSNYGNHLIVERYKKALSGGGLGNLTSRIAKSVKWNLQKVVAMRKGQASFPPADEDVPTKELADILTKVHLMADGQMIELNPGAALEAIIEVVYQTNKYMQFQAPWASTNVERINTTIYHCAEAIRIVGILLQPFIPGKAANLLDILGVSESRRKFEDAQFGADLDWGEPILQDGKVWPNLFPPLPVEN